LKRPKKERSHEQQPLEHDEKEELGAGPAPDATIVQRLGLVSLWPIHIDPPSNAPQVDDLDEMDDLIQEAMIQGSLLDEYRRNERAAKAAKEAERDEGGEE
jgi:hypothetical protein